jgi:hypothetical protein
VGDNLKAQALVAIGAVGLLAVGPWSIMFFESGGLGPDLGSHFVSASLTAVVAAVALGSIVLGRWTGRLLGIAAIALLALGVRGSAMAVVASVVVATPLLVATSGVALWMGIRGLVAAARQQPSA